MTKLAESRVNRVSQKLHCQAVEQELETRFRTKNISIADKIHPL